MLEGNRTLLLVTAEDVEDARREVRAGISPRKDYLELAGALGADILALSDVQANPTARRLDRLVRRGAGHAYLASRRISEYDTIYSDGEHMGLLLGIALARKQHRPRHVMLGHSLSAWKKRPLAAFARDGIDAVVVHCSAQVDFAIHTLLIDPGRVYLIPYQVDVGFWKPQPGGDELVLVSAGLERRDYGTLIEAVRDLPVGVRVAASSRWSHNRDRLRGRRLPLNMTVGAYDYVRLRELYSQARVVVVPVQDVDFQAGITTILEAMAMGKAVIATRTRGQRETVVGPLWRSGQTAWPTDSPSPEDSTGIYVPPRDADALRSAISYLLARPELVSVLGGNGRRFAEEHVNTNRFVERLAPIIDPSYASAGFAATDLPRGA
ncbi:MAG: glycosyltransferase family 4 protein [Dehalococcoidia bacterium]